MKDTSSTAAAAATVTVQSASCGLVPLSAPSTSSSVAWSLMDAVAPVVARELMSMEP